MGCRPWRCRRTSRKLSQRPYQNQALQVGRFFIFKRFDEDAQGSLDMPFNCIEWDMKAFGYFSVFKPIKPTEDKHLSAALRQRIHNTLYLTFQFLIQERMLVFNERKIVVIQTLFSNFYLCLQLVAVSVNNIFVLQIVETSVAGDDEQ